MVVTVRDESASGKVLASFPLEFPTERITVGDLIRERVYQEVQDRELRVRSHDPLVKPEEVERKLNGCAPKMPASLKRNVDWKKQFELACEAFERNGFFVLVDNRQVESLNETVEIGPEVSVSFVKLTPLVGG